MDSKSPLSAADLIRLISEAFDGVPPSPDSSLRVARAMDGNVPDGLLPSIREQDTQHCWQEVSDAEIEEFSDVHPFLDAPAYRFYLPGFLSWCIRHPDSSIPVLDSTLASLWLFPERLELLEPPERQAIAEFLKYAAGNFDACARDEAIKLYVDYWAEYDRGLRQQK